MKKKYKILKDQFKTLEDGKVVYRIQALRDFSDVKKGDLGGWVQKKYNLSHAGDCWIYDDAVVRDGAVVRDNAIVYDNAVIKDYSMVTQNAIVFDNDIVTKNTLYFHTIPGLTLTDNHIRYGNIKKTIQEWKEWLDDDTEIMNTPRDTKKFKRIENILKYVIKYHELR